MTTVISGNSVAQAGALLGDLPANILLALMDGRALTAGELRGMPASAHRPPALHLAKLVEGNLLTVIRQGRHRYHRLASTEVARAIEAVSELAATGPTRHRPAGHAIRHCVLREPATITSPVGWPSG